VLGGILFLAQFLLNRGKKLRVCEYRVLSKIISSLEGGSKGRLEKTA